MKRKNILIIFAAASLTALVGCKDFLDTGIDRAPIPETLATNYGTLWETANAFYSPMRNGFTIIDDNLFAAASDEAQATDVIAQVAYYNNGMINANFNPLENRFQMYYEGIRAAHYFIDYAKDGEEFLKLNRDIDPAASETNWENYERDVRRLNWYRAESYVAQAYYYAELIKLYGGVPIVKTTMDKDANKGKIPRSSYDEVVEHIVSLIDGQMNNIQPDWAVANEHGDNLSNYHGRFDKAAAMAIKARTLLYAASPRNNPGGDVSKWERAARAAHDLMDFRFNGYTMPENRDYRAYFSGTDQLGHKESIYLIRSSATDAPERNNYPIGTPGGNSGVAPTENLVQAYEYLDIDGDGVVDQDAADRYNNRDPRLTASIVINGSSWNGRTINQSPGGQDDMAKANTSRTGYYLKKFLAENLNMTQGGTAQHLWPLFRYAEVLLNYAEAMNEAYGPDAIPAGYTRSAREALMEVRNAASTMLPTITTTDKAQFRAAVKRERQVELAFEDHRYWDLIRWGDAMTVLNQPIKGLNISEGEDGLTYTVVDVNTRTFMERNYYWPFRRIDIENSNGTLTQNQNY